MPKRGAVVRGGLSVALSDAPLELHVALLQYAIGLRVSQVRNVFAGRACDAERISCPRSVYTAVVC
ncbi:hypothetical protein CERZMDRAFT_91871 [Cercospora zeae-maydis SCOH1-5]|uniref:Uncharacterized protein n=1 Tax=Cercospora zeae-maydis SCOH1-5 TaxID=717836 RepID=A0A6A6F1B3_9PEZI|nr:hypothetical protein CERZMDRAFT_91871 [Cercospora zeae-maydis SCOH1-5]